ncbi:ATP-dependent endonuclease [Sporosarcina sp. P33]|uniref:ATP-dependent endonuclease n=1 Tax=Sporosarcina sp. P33 TaxID=1930764 RepID=UPI0009C24BA2|nr:ATP-dependent endonuclease [Sporosarcina sp. P33]ARD48490.1 hypothetical protein SporoP33_09870 [Sporosarcina sp. P33]
MRIKSIQIKNFKKLKDVSINLSEEQSIFVGANNSGKTSAMEAISKFLKRKSQIGFYDFTIYNWQKINASFEKIQDLKIKLEQSTDENELAEIQSEYDDAEQDLKSLLPSMKIVISIEESELQKVIEIIPSIEKDLSEVSVFFRFEPEDYEKLFKEYIEARKRINQMSKIIDGHSEKAEIEKAVEKQWPMNFQDFLKGEGQLKNNFKIQAYLANPAEDEDEFPCDESTALEGNPLKNIIKVDEIYAQRGLSDKDDDENIKKIKKLSKQFTNYYKKFDMKTDIDQGVIDLINANFKAERNMENQLDKTLTTLVKPLLNFGYPGFGSPHIKVAPVIDVVETMDNESSVLFNVHPDNKRDSHYYLPERNNGLGFQNLISMFFELIYFTKERIAADGDDEVKALHLILIEEPEAHLHAQAQKVFIEKALSVIKENQGENLHTQLVMSTHSSHIADHACFDDLLYFKRRTNEDLLHEVEVVNLENVELDDDLNETNKRFVERYLQLAAHDIFFADGIIMIEGAGERILLPRIIKKDFPMLGSKYLTIMEVGGAYAHKFFPLLESLERPVLIITDIDSVEKGSNGKWNKTYTRKSQSLRTSNATLKKIFDDEVNTKELLEKSEDDKLRNGFIRIVYQNINHATIPGGRAYSRTFEDDFAMSNREFINAIASPTGLLKKFKDILDKSPKIKADVSEKLFIATNKGKTQFALDVIYGELENDKKFNTPQYISEGLNWLQEMLNDENKGVGIDEA